MFYIHYLYGFKKNNVWEDNSSIVFSSILFSRLTFPYKCAIVSTSLPKLKLNSLHYHYVLRGGTK